MRRQPHRRVASAAIVSAIVLAACASSATTNPSREPSDAGAPVGGAASSPARSDLPPAAAGSAPSPGTAVESDGSVATAPAQAIPGQTLTTWGEIWEELPNGFPVSTVGRVSQLPSHPSSSGAFDVEAPAEAVAPAFQAALEGAHFSTLSMSGPFDDGNVIIESADPDASGCRVQTTVAPLGARSRITILYGAACPFPMT
jgi:hypothetical protein